MNRTSNHRMVSFFLIVSLLGLSYLTLNFRAQDLGDTRTFHAPLVSGVNVPAGILHYVPIILSNNQSSPTPAPFQQMLTINSSEFSGWESLDLQNTEFFYSDGIVIPSWLEGGASSTSTNTIYWLRLGNGMPARNNITVYMGFAGTSISLFNGVRVGEAPELTSTYGHYDSGPSVFAFYDNFHGTSLGSSWKPHMRTGSYTVNDGLSLNWNPTGDYFVTSPTFGPGMSFDAYTTASNMAVETGFIDPSEPLVSPNSGAGAYAGAFIRADCNTAYPDQWNQSGDEANACGSRYGSFVIGLPVSGIYSVDVLNRTSSLQLLNYSTGHTHQPVTVSFPRYPIPVGFQGSIASAEVQWARVRNAPPNGVMPAVKVMAPPADFGIAATPASVTIADSGSSTITVAAQGDFAGTVTLSADPLPSGLTCSSISPGSIATSGTATVSCASSRVGVYTVTIMGASGSTIRMATFTLTVTDFRVTASTPASVSTGQSAVSTIRVAASNGFTGTVYLTDGIPSGLFCTAISPHSVTTSGTATLSCKSTEPGTYLVTITGFSGPTLHTATIKITVNAPRAPTPSQPKILGLAPALFYPVSAAAAIATIVIGLIFLRRREQ